MSERTWVIMVYVDLWHEYTAQAAADVLEQTAPCRLLLVDNGSGREDAAAADAWLRACRSWGDHQAVVWHHNPPLTLSASWNAALRAAWASGAERALVVNNDLRLPRQLLEHLGRAMDETGALFISAINVAGQGLVPEEEFVARERDYPDVSSRGGPDFSCFLISRECHERYQFDEQFTYCNDLDFHRRIMLSGEGKRIFSVCVPYLHYASRTINRHPEMAKVAERHRELYREKWGGPVNEEVFVEAYNGGSPIVEDVAKPRTTPELQALSLQGKCCYRDDDADGNCDRHHA